MPRNCPFLTMGVEGKEEERVGGRDNQRDVKE